MSFTFYIKNKKAFEQSLDKKLNDIVKVLAEATKSAGQVIEAKAKDQFVSGKGGTNAPADSAKHRCLRPNRSVRYPIAPSVSFPT